MQMTIGEPLLVTAEVVDIAVSPVRKGVDRVFLHLERAKSLAEGFGDFSDAVLAEMGADEGYD